MLRVLGDGRQVVAVEALEPVRYHGAPGLVWAVRARLGDGRVVRGLADSTGRCWFADPRILDAHLHDPVEQG
jgi:hypothetical protein